MGAARREAPPPSAANPPRREIASPLRQPRRKFTVSQTFESSRNTEIFPALGDPLARQEGRAPRSRSLTSPFAAEVAGARSRRKFSLLQSFEKSENAEILRRHRGAPCLPNVDWDPRGRLPLTTASGVSPLLRNSKVAQSRVCLGPPSRRRSPSDRRFLKSRCFRRRGSQREGLTAKRSGPEMAPQRFEKIESAPGNGMVWEASNPQDLVYGRAADRARLRLTSRKNALLQKKAPNALKLLDAELKLQPRSTARRRGLAGRRPGCFLAAPRDDGWRP